jgi:hypothetical protein
MRMVDSDMGEKIALTDAVDERRLAGRECDTGSGLTGISGRSNPLDDIVSYRPDAPLSNSGMD